MVWGQSLMSPGQNTFTPARDGLAVWIRNAGLTGECPASGWTCGLPPFPGLRQSSDQSWPTSGSGRTPARVGSPGGASPSWARGFCKGLCWADNPEEASFPWPGEPRWPRHSSLPARHSLEQAPSHHPGGCLPSTYFYQTTTDKRAEGPHRNRGEKYRGPLPPNPRCGTQSSPHFLGPPVKGWSWVTSARHCHLAQGKPTFQDGIFVLSSCLPPNSASGRALPENSNTWSWLQKPLS